jgi:hypothetical protein
MQMDDEDAHDGRHETELERADRNLDELLQELRVLTTGVQILLAFLLTVPFSKGFPKLDSGERYLYLAILIFAAAAVGLLIAPTAMHRLVFRQGDKRHLVRVANRMAIGGIACLAMAMTGIVALISGYLFGWVTGGILAVATGSYLVTLWFLLGLRRRMIIRRETSTVGSPPPRSG